ncbi:hypothetical protein CK203_108642 [Vitis vinifera]|uniref:RNase H type-1 domain-containing protein n=1 Tax=Vitis vinifera TaxID=29760 RepID=A0A438BP55_VITVI|nr:hypothetical protein CK203_108642 [Vitis vinifera]
MDFVQDDVIHMLSWDDGLPEMIVPDDGYEIVGATSDSSIPAPFSLIPDRASLQLIPFTPSYVGHRDMFAPFILWPEDVDVQVMTRSGRIAQAAPPVTRPFGGTDSHEEVRREDDEILRQLQSTQARISIWSLLATSSIHRDALIRALSQIRVETSTTPEGLIHMMTADRATCIATESHPVLLDNGSALNVCPLATAIALGFAPSDFGPSTQIVRAYDSTQREVMGTLTIDLLIGPTTFSILFQVLRIPASFNLLLGRPWIHQAGAIPSSLHQKVQTLEIQDFCRDFVAMSFDQHSSTLVLDMMRDMSFLPGFGLGRRQHGSNEFVTSIDHELLMDLGSPLRRMMFVIWHDYVGTGGSEIQPRVEEIGVDDSTLGELQHVFHQMQLGDETPDMSASAMIFPLSPDRANLFSLCFPDETTDYGVIIEPEYMTDGVVPRDEYHDEMDMLGISQFLDTVQREPFSPLELFGVSVIEIAKEDQTPDSGKDSFDHDSDPIDKRVSPAIGDVEIVDFGTDDQPRELKIGLPLSTDERNRLIHLLRSYLDVFAWSYEDMSGLDPSIVQHHLPILPHAKPDGKVRVCVDFRNLNKASPKDDFSLPHIDLLVDGTAGHSMLSFMDGFSGVMPFGLKNAGATYQRAATALFHDMMHRDVEVLRLNPKKCTFGVTSGKLLGHMVSERGIEVDPDNIKPYLTCLCQGLRKRSGVFWVVPSMPGRPLLLYLSVSDMALGCMLAQLDDSGKERAIYYLKFDIHYVSQKSIKGSIVADHLASLPTIESRPIDDDFPDEEFVAMTRLSGWRMYFDGAANHSGYGIGVLLYEACILGLETALELGITQMDVLGDSNLVLRQRHNQFANALATLASTVDIPTNVVVRPLLIETRSAPAYCHLIDETEVQMTYHGFMTFVSFLDLAHTLKLRQPGSESIEAVSH